jgi:ATPase subunit of ABC transporter with duplicated ATPase domains
MMPSPIILHNITYSDSQKNLFNSLSLSFSNTKMGLVGRNGAGKTTLLKLIVGEIQPSQGSIQRPEKLRYCPQTYSFLATSTVADILEITAQWHAWQHINSGLATQADFDVLENQWECIAHYYALLNQFGLAHITLDRTVASLSGGERLLATLCCLLYDK